MVPNFYGIKLFKKQINTDFFLFKTARAYESYMLTQMLGPRALTNIQGEIWDNRRNQYRRGRRWWNAYLLFYENIDEVSINDLSQGLSDFSVNSSNSESFCCPQIDRRQLPPIMPSHIRQEVEQQNAAMRHQEKSLKKYF